MTATPSVIVGIHLPQAGPAASGEALRQAAVLAEQLGFRDVWLSDHLLVPTAADYPPSACVLGPLASMAWVAAVTNSVRDGTSILVLPIRNPIEVAKSLARIDQFRDRRVVLGTAAGWVETEFDALGVPFHERGAQSGLVGMARPPSRERWTSVTDGMVLFSSPSRRSGSSRGCASLARSGLCHFDADELGSDGGQPRPDSQRVRCPS